MPIRLLCEQEETKLLLEQIKEQKVEASNVDLKAENERLRDDLESHVDKIADLEMTVQEQKENIDQMSEERDQLRKANEKLRLDLEAITEKGQVIVHEFSLLKPCITFFQTKPISV